MKELLFRLKLVRGSKAINALLLLGIAGLLCACTTVPLQKATIGADAIKNPSVGYKGYTLPIPPGYKVAAPENLPAGIDPRMKNLLAQWKKEFGAGSLDTQTRIFSECAVIYNDKSAFLIGVECLRISRSLSTFSDQRVNEILGGRLRGWFRNDRTIDRKAVLSENRKRALYFGGIDLFGKANYDSIEAYEVVGGLNELYYLVGVSNNSYREELRRVGRELYDTLEFSR